MKGGFCIWWTRGLGLTQRKGLFEFHGLSQQNGFLMFCGQGSRFFEFQPNGVFKFRGLSQPNGFL